MIHIVPHTQINWFPAERKIFRKSARMPHSDWCDEHLKFSKNKRWSKDWSIPMAKFMDLFARPHVRKGTLAKGVQISGTSSAFGWLLSDIERNGGRNAMVILTDEKSGEKLIDGKLINMINHTAPIADLKTGNKNDLQRQEIKLADGSVIYSGWASSLNTLSSVDCPVIIKDEFAKWPTKTGHGANASDEADARADASPDTCKIFELSTHTVEGSPLDESLKEADVTYHYHVRCPHCGEMQEMVWDNFYWPEEKSPREIYRDRLAHYRCSGCAVLWDDADRDQAVKDGDWIPDSDIENPPHIAAICPGWLSQTNTLSKIVYRWLRAQGKPSRLMTWYNHYAAEHYTEEEGEKLPWEEFYGRREKYGPTVPMAAGVLTAYADVQGDRIEAEVVAWGIGEESWGIHYEIFWGSPSGFRVWEELDAFLRRNWTHESGIQLKIAAAGVDTGGHHAKQAYAFVRKKYHRRIYGTKGASQHGKPLVSRPTRSNIGKIPLFLIGTDTAKEHIFSKLTEVKQQGPQYMHFPMYYDEEYFKMLTAEKFISTWKNGRLVREWKKTRERNEALDIRVGNEAILAILRPNLKKIVTGIQAQAAEQESEENNQLVLTAPEVIKEVEKQEEKQRGAARQHVSRTRPSWRQ